MSTVRVRPWRFETLAISLMSRTSIRGLVGDSIQTILVLGLTARSRLSGSVASTLSKETP